METPVAPVDLDVEVLRDAIRGEYTQVACDPNKGFHFHTGRTLAAMLEYEDGWLRGIPESSIESFAGTGNPFAVGPIQRAERVVDVGCGAGMDTLICATMVGQEGRVIGVDMTPAMLEKARRAARSCNVDNVEFREGFMEGLPVEDGWADVVISNGALNLTPDKVGVLREMYRVLRFGGRLQIADILVRQAVPESAKRKIDLWTG
jgi:SAM-dependent methyltransferase